MKQYTDSNFSSLIISTYSEFKENKLSQKDDLFHIVWNQNGSSIVDLDSSLIKLQDNTLISISPNQFWCFKESSNGVVFSFNRDFYCVIDHDHEVSCKGLIFYGNSGINILELNSEYQFKIANIYNIFLDEFLVQDRVQGEMLRLMLKRLIILVTRLTREKLDTQVSKSDEKVDLIREFNFLVENNYKAKQKVSDYAEMLFKSPKTLSNLFSKYNSKSPKQIIEDRIILEAKRLLAYSNMSPTEISYEIGFDEPAHFSRFFKKQVGITAKEFKTNSMGNFDNK